MVLAKFSPFSGQGEAWEHVRLGAACNVQGPRKHRRGPSSIQLNSFSNQELPLGLRQRGIGPLLEAFLQVQAAEEDVLRLKASDLAARTGTRLAFNATPSETCTQCPLAASQLAEAFGAVRRTSHPRPRPLRGPPTASPQAPGSHKPVPHSSRLVEPQCQCLGGVGPQQGEQQLEGWQRQGEVRQPPPVRVKAQRRQVEAQRCQGQALEVPLDRRIC